MALVLTDGSDVSCDHPPSGGGALTLTVAAVGPLTVDGATVLSGSLAPTAVGGGCSQPVSQSSAPCLATVSQTAGTSTVLSVNGRPVLLDDAAGQTNGKPDSAWSAKAARQNVLRAE